MWTLRSTCARDATQGKGEAPFLYLVTLLYLVTHLMARGGRRTVPVRGWLVMVANGHVLDFENSVTQKMIEAAWGFLEG